MAGFLAAKALKSSKYFNFQKTLHITQKYISVQSHTKR